MLDLVISIVNTNNREFLERCLHSVIEQTKGIKYEIWVVDNASDDGSAKMVRDNFPEVNLICNTVREGFPENHNKVLKRTTAQYKLILNEDTVILNGAINKLIDFMKSLPGVGAVSPKLLYPGNCFQISAFSFPTVISEIRKALFIKPCAWSMYKHLQSPIKVDWVLGACLLFNSDILSKAGYLNEGFFIYFEDIEICKKITELGYPVYYYPQAEVIHYHGQTRRSKLLPKLIIAYCNSRDYYFLMHKGLPQLIVLKIMLLLANLLKLLKWLILYALSQNKEIAQDRKNRILEPLIEIKMCFVIHNPANIKG